MHDTENTLQFKELIHSDKLRELLLEIFENDEEAIIEFRKMLRDVYSRIMLANISIDWDALISIMVRLSEYIKNLFIDGGIYLSNGYDITIEEGDNYILEGIFVEIEDTYLILKTKLQNLKKEKIDEAKTITDPSLKHYSEIEFFDQYIKLLGKDSRLILIPLEIIKDIEVNETGIYSSSSKNSQLNSLLMVIETMILNTIKRLFALNKINLTAKGKQIGIWKDIAVIVYNHLLRQEFQSQIES